MFQKMAVTTGKTSPHLSRLVRELLRKNKNLRLVCLPKSSSYLNVIEECRHQGKRVLLVPEYYGKFSDMCNAVSQYYGTVRFDLELPRDANRKAEPFCRDL